MENSETMALIEQQVLELDIETKNRIFEVAKDFSEKTGINISDLLIFANEIYSLSMILNQMQK